MMVLIEFLCAPCLMLVQLYWAPFLHSLIKFTPGVPSPSNGKFSKLSLSLKRETELKLKSTDPLQTYVVLKKFLEKLILKQIHYFEKTNKLDLTGKNQHGFNLTKSLLQQVPYCNQLL